MPETVAEVMNKHANAALAKPDLHAVIEQTGSVVSGPLTLKQDQDDSQREVQICTAIVRSVGLPKQ